MPARTKRRGLSLLEVMVALAVMVMLLGPVIALLRSSQQVWKEREQDHAALEAAHATVRHVTRTLRQATRVDAISSPSDTTGRLSVRMPDNRLLVWERRGDSVFFGQDAADSLLALNIEGLWFVGYGPDGVSPTTSARDIRFVQTFARVRLDREHEPLQTISSKVWIRAY